MAAGDYAAWFGFRRSDETLRWTSGRDKTPVASGLLIGTVVTIDPASPGYLKQAAKNAVPVAGFTGLLLQELEWELSIYGTEAQYVDSIARGIAKANRPSVITGGAGVKVWFKNIAGSTRIDGRVVTARTLFVTTGGLAVGNTVSWDGGKFVKTGQDSTSGVFGTVTAVSSSILEIVLAA